jgi:hypothetical protein
LIGIDNPSGVPCGSPDDGRAMTRVPQAGARHGWQAGKPDALRARMKPLKTHASVCGRPACRPRRPLRVTVLATDSGDTDARTLTYKKRHFKSWNEKIPVLNSI